MKGGIQAHDQEENEWTVSSSTERSCSTEYYVKKTSEYKNANVYVYKQLCSITHAITRTCAGYLTRALPCKHA